MTLPDKIEKKRILVTGATGFLGKYTAIHLLLKGYDVTVQGRDHTKCEELRNLKLTDALQTVFADLTNDKLDQLKFSQVIEASNENMSIDICANKDIVINCIGDVTILQLDKDYEPANVDVVNLLINGCIKYGAHLIHTSSPSVYANYTNRNNISEDDFLPQYSANGYARSKLIAESLIIEAQKNQNLIATQIRPPLVIGPEESHIIAPALKMILEGNIPVFNNGKALIDFTYIGNFVQAIERCVVSENSIGKIYNITNCEPQMLKTILEIVAQSAKIPLQTFPIPIRVEIAQFLLLLSDKVNLALHAIGIKTHPFLTRYTVSTMAQDTTLNNSRIKAIGYAPTTPIKEGIVLATQWCLKYHPTVVAVLEQQKAKASVVNHPVANSETEPLLVASTAKKRGLCNIL